ncbi:MAG: hypothetical protein JXM69_04610 [Anaerolineae bacterium]|nr:hypothetical protein [Anaerolineae bacterium]
MRQIGTSAGHRTWAFFELRDEVTLWRTYFYADPIGAYGKTSNGLLLKFLTESGNEVKVFASKEDGTPDWAPTLIVDYRTEPRDLNHQVPLHRRAPSPDYFATPDDGTSWKAVGIRTLNSSANYGLELHPSSTYSWKLVSTSTSSEDNKLYRSLYWYIRTVSFE